MNANHHRSTWLREIVRRSKKHLLLKVVGTTAFMWIFFIGYFHLLRHPASPVVEMPLLALDRLIGFQPWALGAYVSLWFYVGIAPGLLLSVRQLLAYASWIGALCATGLACFYFWPNAVPPQPGDPGQYPGFGLLQGIDAAGNACPSLHVATAVFSAIWLDHLLRDMRTGPLGRAANWCWVALIAYSTLAIKQHVTLDVIAGALLGAGFALPALRWRPRDPPARHAA